VSRQRDLSAGPFTSGGPQRGSPRRSLASALAAVALSLATGIAAQEEPPVAETFFEDLEVRVVNVDVLVTDRAGNPVLDLGKGDFRLLEDGKEVNVSHFAPPRRAAAPGAASAGPGEAPATVPLDAPRRRTNWVLYLDQTRIAPADRNRALRTIREFLFANASPDDRMAIISYNGSTLRHSTGLTSDSDRIGLELDELERVPALASQDRAERVAILTEIGRLREQRRPAGASSAQLSDQLGVPEERVDVQLNQEVAQQVRNLAQRIRMLAIQESQRDEASLRAFSQALVTLGGLEGRKVMFRVGGGLSSGRMEELTEMLKRRVEYLNTLREIFTTIERDLRFEDTTQTTSALLAEITRRANAAGVTVIAVDASGLEATSGVAAEFEGAGRFDAGTTVGRAHADLAETLKVLATETGGSYVRTGGNLTGQLFDAGNRVLATYSLGYEPPGRRRDGEYHKVEVQVLRPGLKASHRHGRQDFSLREQAQVTALSALLEENPTNSLEMSVETVGSKAGPKQRQRVLSLKVAIPLGALTLVPEGGVHRGFVVAHAATRDAAGTLRLLEGREYPIEISNDQLAGLSETLAWFPLDVLVGEDDADLSVTVFDLMSSMSSSQKVVVVAGE